jgi:hypothetical protein
VIEVLVGDEQEVGADTVDRRVLELDPARGHRRGVAEGVDEDSRLRCAQAKRRLAVPVNLHGQWTRRARP